MPMPLKLLLCQLACQDGDLGANVDALSATVREHAAGRDLLLFPEAFLTGFPDRETTRRLAEPLDGPLVRRLTSVASEAGTSLVVGMAERDGDDVYNTTVLVTPEGLLLAYRKTHLWVTEPPRVEAGDSFAVADVLGVPAGLLICYDVEFPETARAVASLGAELLLVTDGNMDPYGPVHRLALQARAQDNHMIVAMANRVGPGLGLVFAGGSMAVDPFGRIIAEAGREETVLPVDVDLDLVRQARSLEYNYLDDCRLMPPLEETESGKVRRARIASPRKGAGKVVGRRLSS